MRNRKSTLGACIVLLAAGAGFAAGTPEDEVKAAEKAWAEAVVKNDTTALGSIYDDRLIYAHSTGVVQSKADYIGQLRSGARKYTTLAPESIRVEAYGDAAVAHYLARTVGSVDGKAFNDHVMVLHLWVKQGGKWRLAAHQTTKVG